MLSVVPWDGICFDSENDANISDLYDRFNCRFINIFNSYFPIENYKMSKRLTPRNEWMTRGLAVSCNKKSVLYKDYINNRTVEKKIYLLNTVIS